MPSPFESVNRLTPGAEEKLAATKLKDLFKIPVPSPRASDELHAEFITQQNLRLSNPEWGNVGKSLYGIEVEAENILHIDPNLSLLWWKIVEDGSLRNRGREFVSIPLPQKVVPYALTQLFNGLNESVDFSIRTSVHIHQDVRGMTLQALSTLLFTYVAVENLLFKFAGNSRKSSIYCVPLSDTNWMRDAASWRGLFTTLRHAEQMWSKYTACNLIPVRTQGTLEYRHLPGSRNIAQILVWIELLNRLKVWAYKTPYQVAMDTISELNTTSSYHKFLTAVFGEYIQYLDTTTVMHDMERNVWWVKNCAFANSFHKELTWSWRSPLAKQYGYEIPEEVLTPEKHALWKEIYDKYYSAENEILMFWTAKRNLGALLNNLPAKAGAQLKSVINEIQGPK